MKVKICGLTRLEDVQLALELGASEIGFIFAPSPRKIEVQKAKAIVDQLDPQVRAIGVFVDHMGDSILEIAHMLNLKGVQLHGSETDLDIRYLKINQPSLYIIKAINPQTEHSIFESSDVLLYDSVGSHFRPSERKPIGHKINSSKPFYLAGGLNPTNIRELVQFHNPFGIDLSSGIESSPGIKDPNLMKELFSNIKEIPCNLM